MFFAFFCVVLWWINAAQDTSFNSILCQWIWTNQTSQDTTCCMITTTHHRDISVSSHDSFDIRSQSKYLQRFTVDPWWFLYRRKVSRVKKDYQAWLLEEWNCIHEYQSIYSASEIYNNVPLAVWPGRCISSEDRVTQFCFIRSQMTQPALFSICLCLGRFASVHTSRPLRWTS